MPRNRQLTDAEKSAIWRYHKEHPLVTHTDVGAKFKTANGTYVTSAFFGVERSTVSKIVHQNHYQSYLDDSGYSTPLRPDAASQPLPNLEAQCALDEYLENSDRRGLPVTWAMIRKKAAIVAASTWLERSQRGTHAATIEGSSCSESDRVGAALPRALKECSLPRVMAKTAPDGTILSTDAVPGPAKADNLDEWIQPELAQGRAGLWKDDIEVFAGLSERFSYSNESTNTNEPMDYMMTTLSTEGNIALQEPVPSNKEECSHLEAGKALDKLSQHLAQSDKLTTCDVICLSHLQDRLRGFAKLG